MPSLSTPRSGCPIAQTLEIVGDRWSLVILRDMVNGKARYTDFLSSPEAITTNVLADRLMKLEAQGIITSEPYQRRPKRFAYALTAKGWALLPVLQEICKWGNAHLPGTWVPPESFMRRTAAKGLPHD